MAARRGDGVSRRDGARRAPESLANLVRGGARVRAGTRRRFTFTFTDTRTFIDFVGDACGRHVGTSSGGGEARGVAVTSRRGAPSSERLEARAAEDPRREPDASAGGGAIGVAERGGPSLERCEGATTREKHTGVVRGGEGDVVTFDGAGEVAGGERVVAQIRGIPRGRHVGGGGDGLGARGGRGGGGRGWWWSSVDDGASPRAGKVLVRALHRLEPRDVAALVGMKRPGERAVRATRIRFRRPRRDAERGARGLAGHRRVRVTGTRAARRHRGTEGRTKGVAPRRVRGIGRVAPLGNARPPPAREASAVRSW